MTDITRALEFGWPEKKGWSVTGNSYAGIEWPAALGSRPTEAEVLAAATAAAAAPIVPVSVTPLQARKALLAAGVLDQVQAYVDLQPQSVQLAWDYALEVRRDDPMINAAVDALEWTQQQLDDLFIAAAEYV